MNEKYDSWIAEDERSTRKRQIGLVHNAMQCVNKYLKDHGSTERKRHRKIQEFCRLNNIEAPKQKKQCVSLIIELYKNGTNEFCRKQIEIEPVRKFKTKEGYKAADRFDPDLIECAKQIDSVLDSGKQEYIKLNYVEAYLTDYRGYFKSDLQTLELYVDSRDLKTFLKVTDIIHTKYLKSLKWAQMKDYVRERDNYICAKCGANMSNDLYNLHTHHLNYERLGEENPATDLILLCSTCHHKEHSKEK